MGCQMRPAPSSAASEEASSSSDGAQPSASQQQPHRQQPQQREFVPPSAATDELLIKMTRGGPILFAHPPATPAVERRRELERCLRDRRLPITFRDFGLNLLLPLTLTQRHEGSTKVTLEASFVFNGIPVLFSGEICTDTLHGRGRVRVDESAPTLFTPAVNAHIQSVLDQLGIQ